MIRICVIDLGCLIFCRIVSLQAAIASEIAGKEYTLNINLDFYIIGMLEVFYSAVIPESAKLQANWMWIIYF